MSISISDYESSRPGTSTSMEKKVSLIVFSHASWLVTMSRHRLGMHGQHPLHPRQRKMEAWCFSHQSTDTMKNVLNNSSMTLNDGDINSTNP